MTKPEVLTDDVERQLVDGKPDFPVSLPSDQPKELVQENGQISSDLVQAFRSIVNQIFTTKWKG